MQVKGQAHLPASRQRVWEALLDPAALRHCLPGCQDMREVGELEWEATLTVGLAGIKGTYKGKVRLTDLEPQTRYTMSVEGSGAGNRIKGSGVVTVRDGAKGGTEISYEGDAQIAGVLASVGQRLFQPAVRTLADQFFKCMGSQVKE